MDSRKNYRLKVSPDNTVTIRALQEEKTSWSREEIVRFAEKYARMVQEKPIQLNAYKIIHNNKWIEENL
jgi:pyruvate-formate lyase-activating enzyme